MPYIPEMTPLALDFIEKLPKTDLHCHLDGSLRIETILDLAQKQKVKLPAEDPDKLFKLIYAGERCSSLGDYLKAFDITLSVMQTEESLFRTAYELAEDCARENVRYLEVRYSPMLHTQRGLKLAPIVEAVIQGLRAGERDFGVRSGVILCGIRSISAESSLRMAELCVAFKNRGVIGFDLAGAEYNYPAKDHKQAFQLILNNNVNCTAHAGEAYGPESIAQAIHYCGAHRIGHGTRLRENGDLLNYVNDHRIPLEICSQLQYSDRCRTRSRVAPAPVLLQLRVAGHHQHRQPPRHRHHRVKRDAALPSALRDGARRPEGADHQRLQERVSPLSREGGPAEEGDARAGRFRRAGRDFS